MKCPDCNMVLDMRVQIGIVAPSDLEGKFTKGMFRKKTVQLEYALWETATYICPHCGYIMKSEGNYVSKLRDENKELKERIQELEERMFVENWYVQARRLIAT